MVHFQFLINFFLYNSLTDIKIKTHMMKIKTKKKNKGKLQSFLRLKLSAQSTAM